MSRTGCRAPFKLKSVILDISSLVTFSKVMFCELMCFQDLCDPGILLIIL